MKGGTGPLTGIKVVELGGIGPVPFACTLLANLGATVVRIERDAPNGLPKGYERLGIRNRIFVTLDLKQPEELAIARTLILGADAVVEGFRPGVAERLGLGPEDMRDENPSLVYVRVTGWGQAGPYASMAGHDINYIGLSGVLATIGSDEPVPPLNLVGDYAGGALYGVVGLLAALIARRASGVGDTIDAAMVDGSSALLAPIRDLANVGLWSGERSSNLLDGGAPFYRTYETADGGYMAVGALEPQFFAALLAGLGLDELDIPDRDDPANWPELHALFRDVFLTRTRDQWTEVFEGTDACATPVLTMDEAAGHPHAKERGSFLETDAGLIAAAAPRFESQSVERRGGAAGSDTLRSFGLDPGVVDRLERGGMLEVVFEPVRLQESEMPSEAGEEAR